MDSEPCILIKQMFDLYNEFLWIRDSEIINLSDNVICINVRYALKEYDSIDGDLDYDEKQYAKICLDFERSFDLILKETLCKNNEILSIKCEKWNCVSTIAGNEYRYVSTREMHPTKVENKIRIYSNHFETFHVS